MTVTGLTSEAKVDVVPKQDQQLRPLKEDSPELGHPNMGRTVGLLQTDLGVCLRMRTD